MTYKQIQDYYKKQYDKTIKTCWIADVRRELGLPTRRAYNRKNESFVIYPCPQGEVKKRIKYIIKLNQKKMKTSFFIIIILLLSLFVQAQKVYSVQYANQADIKIFVVDYPNQADLKVYKVKYNNQVSKNEGLWFFTEYSNQADKKVYFVKYNNLADLKIYFVEYPNQAGWNDNSKKQYFY